MNFNSPIFQEIRENFMELNKQLHEFAQSDPAAFEACEVLSEVNFLKRDLSEIYDQFAEVVPDLMGNVLKLTLNDGTQVEKTTSLDRRKWRHREIGTAVAERLVQSAVDMDTGEVTKSTRQIAIEMLDYCAPSYWRIKELGKIGVNPDNYCETGELRTSIIVRKPKDN